MAGGLNLNQSNTSVLGKRHSRLGRSSAESVEVLAAARAEAAGGRRRCVWLFVWRWFVCVFARVAGARDGAPRGSTGCANNPKRSEKQTHKKQTHKKQTHTP